MRLKTCKNCNHEFPISQFATAGKGKVSGTQYYKPYCRPCVEVMKTRAYNKVIEDFFGGFICASCGFKGEPRQFDCHHTNPKNKSINVAHLRGLKKSTIIKELEKCELLCANCHRLE